MSMVKNLLCLYSIFLGGIWAQNLKAAVVEFSPKLHQSPVIPETRLNANVALYEQLAKEHTASYDIIVFPEATLYTGISFKAQKDIFPYSTLVPSATQDIIPCTDTQPTYPTFFKRLSCIAKTEKKHVVVNLAENQPCTHKNECPEAGYYVYNTNVVFNADGKVVAKYRKRNLFGENYMTQPELELVTFNVNGFKIGLFTCFDILFKQPALELIKKEKVDAVVYPLMWFSELPFLTALQSQEQFTRELDVILLAAGANNPFVGSGGSGIYNGKNGARVTTITGARESKVLLLDIKNVQKMNTSKTISVQDIDTKAKEMDSFFLQKDDLKSYTSQLLDPKEPQVNIQVCNGVESNKLCCDFNVITKVDEAILNDGKNHYQYHLVAFSGIRTFSGVATGGIEVCAVVACKEQSLDSCGSRFADYNTISWPLTFKEIEVKAKFVTDENRTQYPNSLLSNIQPLPVTETEWATTTIENVIERKHTIKTEQNRLLTFGIYGRDFSRDGQEVTKPEDKDSGSNFIKLESTVLIVAVLLFIVNTVTL